MKKNLFTLSCIVVAGLTFSACSPKTTSTTGNTKDIDPVTNSDYSITQSETRSLGACDATTKAAVEAATGKTVNEPKTTGVINVMGSKTETCIYGFDGEDVVTNSFYVDIEEFATQDELNESKEYSGYSAMKVVSGLGDEAYFTSSETMMKTTEHVLKVLKGQRKYTFAVSQPTESASFTTEAGEKLVTDMAKASEL